MVRAGSILVFVVVLGLQGLFSPAGWAKRVEVDELAILRDPSQRWSYELVGGASLDALAPIPRGPAITCGVADVTATSARIVCAPRATSGAPLLALVLGPRTLVFDQAGVRELRGDATPAALADKTNALALTFPKVMAGPRVFQTSNKPGASVRIATRTDTRLVGGATRTVWIAEAVTTEARPRRGAKAPAAVRTAAVFAPEVGPILMCRKRDAGAPAWVCLRLVDQGADQGDPLAPDAPLAPEAPVKRIPEVKLARKLARMKTSLTADKLATKVAGAYLADLRRCYGRVLASKPRAAGKLALVFTVNAVGKTEEIAVTSFDDRLSACARGLVVGWRFPIPLSGYAEPIAVRYELDYRLAVVDAP